MDAAGRRFGFKKARGLLSQDEAGESRRPPKTKSEVRQRHFFIKSSTALVNATTPLRIVGSRSGANLLECKLGSGGAPGFFESAIFSGATTPT